jgi:acyl-CoA thioesterase
MSHHLSPTAVEGEKGAYLYPGMLDWTSWNGPFGGALLGSMIESMEQCTGQKLVALTAQFLKTAKHGVPLTFKVDILAAGRAVSQVRASAHQDGSLLFTGSGVLASSSDALAAGCVGDCPVVRPAESSPARTYMKPIKGGLNDTVDIRIAETAASRVRLWARCPAASGMPLGAALLAAFADHPPYGVGLLRGGEWYGITLDSTLRIAAPSADLDGASWVLLDIGFEAMGEQFGFATVNLWTTDGRLLGIGTQTLRLRNGIAPARK